MSVVAVSSAWTEVNSFVELRHLAQRLGPKRVGVVVADDDIALTAAADALRSGIAQPVLIGDNEKIREKAHWLGLHELLAGAELVAATHDAAAPLAVRMAREGSIDILMKGHLRSDDLLHPVLDKTNGLRAGRLLSDVALFEYEESGKVRLVGLTDGGINIAPSLEQKKGIVWNAIEVMHCLGMPRPKIAILSASEAVMQSMPSTLDAKALTDMGATGEFGDAQVYGPLALDNALLEWAAKVKEISNPVAGHADCQVTPTIEACNLLGKSIMFLKGGEYGHVVVGVTVPILIPSRVESARDKVNAIALGVLFACR